MSPGKRLSIIIVNWKVRELLRECLLSLFRNTALPRDQYEVVVIDNDSGDGSVAMIHAEFPEVTAISNNENIGFGAANNQAMEYCKGEWILLLNPDTVVLPGAIDRMLEKIEASPRIAILGCRLQNGDGSLQRWTGGAFPTVWNLASHYFFLDRLLPAAMRPSPLYLDRDATQDVAVDWVSGACMLLRRSVVGDKVFNPHFFMYGEDMELCYRIREAGHDVVYTPAASITHFQGESIKQQKGEIMLSSLKGPRQFYLMTHGRNGIYLFDWVTLCGFVLRWLIFSMGALAGGTGMRERANSSWQYTEIIRRLMKADTKNSSGT
jgi:N-acetylglucosaminyl-diphospho-decaprenol L-rhamnosyltransferase